MRSSPRSSANWHQFSSYRKATGFSSCEYFCILTPRLSGSKMMNWRYNLMLFFLNVTGQLNTFWGLSWLSLYFLRLLRSQSATCIFHPVLVLIGILDGCWITPFHLPIDFSLGQTPLFWFVKCWHGVPRTSCRFLSQQGLDIYTKTLHLEYSFSLPDSACFDISPPQQCRSPSSLK